MDFLFGGTESPNRWPLRADPPSDACRVQLKAAGHQSQGAPLYRKIPFLRRKYLPEDGESRQSVFALPRLSCPALIAKLHWAVRRLKGNCSLPRIGDVLLI